MKHTGLFCKLCGTFIFSRANHDFRSCKCNGCYVDGGFDYLRFLYKKAEDKATIKFELPEELTQKLLHYDWSSATDMHGYYEVGEWPTWAQAEIIKVFSPK